MRISDDFRYGSLALGTVPDRPALSAFQTWALSFAGCDGGDIGSPEKPSIWICGIEWGGAHTTDQLKLLVNNPPERPLDGYEDWQHNLAYPFNRQTMKLLSAISGGLVGDYRLYAEKARPFTKGSSGFFKMNLFPLGFKDTTQAHWKQFHSKATGFDTKNDYLAWCREHRLPLLRSWHDKHRPKLIICLGKGFIRDYSVAFGAEIDQYSLVEIDDRELRWQISSQGTIVVVLPFMIGPNGLVRNQTIQKVGEKIGEIVLV